MTTKKNSITSELTLHGKLVDIQQRLHVPKGQTNEFGGGYKYRSCEDILSAAKPLCNEHGLTLKLDDAIEVFGDRFYVMATAVISDGTDSISSDAYAREAEAKKGMDASQVTGAASSYARKYALNGLFAIDDTKDADTQKPEDPDSPISKDMLNEIMQLVERAEIPVQDVCKWAGVSNMALLPVGFFERVQKKLRATIKAKKGSLASE